MGGVSENAHFGPRIVLEEMYGAAMLRVVSDSPFEGRVMTIVFASPLDSPAAVRDPESSRIRDTFGAKFQRGDRLDDLIREARQFTEIVGHMAPAVYEQHVQEFARRHGVTALALGPTGSAATR